MRLEDLGEFEGRRLWRRPDGKVTSKMYHKVKVDDRFVIFPRISMQGELLEPKTAQNYWTMQKPEEIMEFFTRKEMNDYLREDLLNGEKAYIMSMRAKWQEDFTEDEYEE